MIQDGTSLLMKYGNLNRIRDYLEVLWNKNGENDRVKYRSRKLKRRFYGNQHSRKEVVEQQQPDRF